jgi:hypothetical protein
MSNRKPVNELLKIIFNLPLQQIKQIIHEKNRGNNSKVKIR